MRNKLENWMDFVRETSDDRSSSDKSPDICIRYEGTRGNDKSTLSTWAEQMAIDMHKLHWLVTVQECIYRGVLGKGYSAENAL